MTAGSPRPDRSKPAAGRGNLRQQTLDAAVEILGTEGIAGLSMRNVATRAGCSTMAAYHYFGNKQGLLDALYSEGFDRLRKAQTPPLGSGDPRADVRAMALKYRTVALLNPEFYQIMFASPIKGFKPAPESQAHARATYLQWVEAIAKWAEVDELVMDVPSAAHVFWSLGHGLMMLELNGNAPAGDRAHRFEMGTDAIMQGLTKASLPPDA